MFTMEKLRDQRVSMKNPNVIMRHGHSCHWWNYEIKHVQKERDSPSLS